MARNFVRGIVVVTAIALALPPPSFGRTEARSRARYARRPSKGARSRVRDAVIGAFANLPAATGSSPELATMLYFSLTTLTTTGYGDIVAVDPLARSLANFEAVAGQFYLAIMVVRLVMLELADRRR